MKTLRLLCLAGGGTTPHDGKYVVHYDPSPIKTGGAPVLITTADVNQAATFRDFVQAMRCYQRSSGLTRPDGKEDRPLTAWHVEVESVLAS